MARQDTPLFLHGFDLSGHFVDPRPLGTGVTGVVLSAVDQRNGQRVAIKKLVMRDAVTVKHALREVKITHRLHHENVVQVHEVLAPYGRPLPRDPTQLSALYIVQECMETDLARLLEQGPLPTGMGAKKSHFKVHRKVFLKLWAMLRSIGTIQFAKIHQNTKQ